MRRAIGNQEAFEARKSASTGWITRRKDLQGVDSLMSCLPVAISGRSPVVTICVIRFPQAVASMGPAWTESRRMWRWIEQEVHFLFHRPHMDTVQGLSGTLELVKANAVFVPRSQQQAVESHLCSSGPPYRYPGRVPEFFRHATGRFQFIMIWINSLQMGGVLGQIVEFRVRRFVSFERCAEHTL